ncbi:hypothetical protein D9M69_639120 [compost metagenome]
MGTHTGRTEHLDGVSQQRALRRNFAQLSFLRHQIQFALVDLLLEEGLLSRIRIRFRELAARRGFCVFDAVVVALDVRSEHGGFSETFSHFAQAGRRGCHIGQCGLRLEIDSLCFLAVRHRLTNFDLSALHLLRHCVELGLQRGLGRL